MTQIFSIFVKFANIFDTLEFQGVTKFWQIWKNWYFEKKLMTQIFSIFVKFANIFDTLDENWLNYLTLYPLFWISSYRIKAPTSQEEWGGGRKYD